MKKTLLTMSIVLLFSTLTQAQEQQQTRYYIYNIVNFEGKLKNEGFKVTIDNGKTIEKLKDKNGNRIKFTTPAGALMWFFSNGWELYLNGSTTEGGTSNGTGGTRTSSYWILRKPCTKEEFEQAAKDAVKGAKPTDDLY